MDETEQMEAERSANFFAKRRLEERGLFRSAIPFRAYERRRAKRSPGRSAPPPSPWMRLSKWRPSDLRIFSRSSSGLANESYFALTDRSSSSAARDRKSTRL